METLRRAALYTDRDVDRATTLIAALMARALDTEASEANASLAWLDAGYLAQCYDQLGIRTGVRCGAAGGIVGYAWVQRSLELNPDDAELEFAAAMVTSLAGGAEHERHVSQVRKLADPGSLVSRNLKVHAKKYWSDRRHFRDVSARYRRSQG